MKAKELMIGDLVNFNTIEFPRLGMVNAINGNGLIEICHYAFVEEAISPIPLTLEILKKNGFQCVNNGYETVCKGPSYGPFDLWNVYVLLNERGIFLASEYGRGDTDAHEYSIIHYVHELQHALRLCGFADMADNFKI